MGKISKLLARLVVLTTMTLLTLITTPRLAYADEAAAETLFQEGLAAMKRNDYVVACEAFAQSNKADASPGTQINLALCYEKQKKWASAWTWYRSAVGLAQQRGQKEREQLAEDSANRLKPQLHYIVISVKEPLSDMVVKRDGAEVTIALAGKEVPLAIDPGEHTIEVSARGKKAHVQKVVMEDNNKTDRIEIPKLADAPVDDKGGGGGGTGNDYRPPVVITNDGSTQRTVGIVVGGAGILAGLAGVGLFILAKNEESERDELRDKANGTPPGDQKTAFDRSADSHGKAADNNQLIAIILGAGAGVLVGVGAILYFTAPKAQEKAAKARVLPHPLVGPNYGGLGLTTTF